VGVRFSSIFILFHVCFLIRQFKTYTIASFASCSSLPLSLNKCINVLKYLKFIVHHKEVKGTRFLLIIIKIL